MIVLYTGTPGSGKSLHLITIIFRALRRGRYVISNFPVRFNEKEIKKGYDKRFFYYTNEQITVESMINFAIDYGMIEKCQENQCMVIIDEAGGRYNCRDFKNSDRAEWIDFFSQHRKLGFDFILVAQSDRMIDRQIRGYVEIEKKHRKINNYGPFFLLPFPVFVAVEHWYTARQRVGCEFFFFRQKVADRYDSMKLFTGFKLSEALLEKIEAKKRGDSEKIEHVEIPSADIAITSIYVEGEALVSASGE